MRDMPIKFAPTFLPPKNDQRIAAMEAEIEQLKGHLMASCFTVDVAMNEIDKLNAKIAWFSRILDAIAEYPTHLSDGTPMPADVVVSIARAARSNQKESN